MHTKNWLHVFILVCLQRTSLGKPALFISLFCASCAAFHYVLSISSSVCTWGWAKAWTLSIKSEIHQKLSEQNLQHSVQEHVWQTLQTTSECKRNKSTTSMYAPSFSTSHFHTLYAQAAISATTLKTFNLAKVLQRSVFTWLEDSIINQAKTKLTYGRPQCNSQYQTLKATN